MQDEWYNQNYMIQLKSFFVKIWNFLKTKWGILIIILLCVLGYVIFHKKTVPHTLITVTKGSVTETVSVTGNTTPTQSVALGFQNGGTVSSVSTRVGDTVVAGQLLASLNTNDLAAQLQQAQANVDGQQAKLDSLKAGSQPEDIASSQAALAKASQDLANMYSSISDISNDGYAKANDAVRTQISSLFSNAENNSIQFTFASSNSQLASNAKTERLTAATSLNTWQTELLGVSSVSTHTDLDTAVNDGLGYLAQIRQMLLDVSGTLNSATNIDTVTLATDKNAVTSALTEINTATKNLNTVAQSIASQKLIVAQAQAQLDLKQAGSTQNDIDAQQAQVEQAKAGVASIQAKISNSLIYSPISGVVTQCDAKVGQIANPGVTVISVISNSQFEVDALIPETDVGKVAVGDPVTMTFDAFTEKTFTGKLFYIDPAQTVTQGVVDYKIKVSFDTADPQMKSGLTANLTIQTQTHTGVLVLPQYAILQNDTGNFVDILVGGVSTSTPVTLGISDQNGNIEVTSGVTEGEQVLNIGLKQ